MTNSRSISIIWLAVAIWCFGLIFVFNTSSAEILDSGRDRFIFGPLLKQLLFGVAAFGLGLLAYRCGMKKILSWTPRLLALCVFLLVLVLIPGVGVIANGARRWLSLFGISLQPSEFVKFILPLFFIHEVLKHEVLQLGDLLKLLGKIAAVMALILIEPDNRTTLIIGATVVIALWLCSIRWRYWLLPLCVGAVAVTAFAASVPYVRGRIMVFLNPELDLLGKGHQPYQAKIALGSGGFFGKGIGQSLQKLSYLPEAQNDYIVAIVGEEVGFLGLGALIVAYMALIWLCFRQALDALEKSVSLSCAMLAFLLALQAFINLGVVTGILPSTGLNLPLFSQGGSSLVACGAALGAILSVSKKVYE